jgi:predicted amidohydrolase YtcJ
MVERHNRNGLAIDPEESTTVGEALRAFTVDAAAATFCENDRGSLEIGKLADLAVLTADPFAVPASRLGAVTSELTMVGGRFAESASAPQSTDGTVQVQPSV